MWTNSRHEPKYAYASFSCFGLAWCPIAGFAWMLLLTGDGYHDPGIARSLLLDTWWPTGFMAFVLWLLSVRSGESSASGWYFAWVGLLMSLSGLAQLIFL